MRALTAPPYMGPQWSRLAPLFTAADTRLASVSWPWLVDTAAMPGLYPRRYRMYYSADGPGVGGVAYAEADDVTGPWTHHPLIYTDTVSGGRTLAPAVHYVAESGGWHMYYRQGPTRLAQGQRCWLATSVDGITWNRIDAELGVGGGLVPQRLPGGRWVACALPAGGWPYLTYAWSDDGIAWHDDAEHPGAPGEYNESGGYLVETDHGTWWMGVVRAAAVQAPVHPSHRILWAPLRPLYPGIGACRAVNVSTDCDGVTWLLLQTGATISYAIAI